MYQDSDFRKCTKTPYRITTLSGVVDTDSNRSDKAFINVAIVSDICSIVVKWPSCSFKTSSIFTQNTSL